MAGIVVAGAYTLWSLLRGRRRLHRRCRCRCGFRYRGRGNRERRSRDRYGRDRRERAPRDAAEQGSETEAAPAMSVAPVDEVATEAPVRSSYFSLPVESSPVAVEEVLAEVAPAVIEPVPVLATPAPRPVAAPEVRKSVPATAPATRGLPKVEPYTVSIDELNQVAAASGLEWINSDTDKVAQVQAAIAAEPKPIHVPREIKPAVVLDEGPLVLVETRKDLRSMLLPFETQ